MRKVYLILFLLFSIQLMAQEEKIYRINPGENVLNTLMSNNGLYQYPQFITGLVVFKNGRLGGGPLNYNRLTDEMQFVDTNGDTIVLSDEKDIEFITIGKDTFFYQQGYLQLTDNFSVKIAKKTILKLANRQRVGNFGETNSAAKTYNTISTSTGIKTLTAKEVLIFTEATSYFIGDRFGHFKPFNKKAVYDYFSKNEKELTAYLNNNPVNYSKQQDIERLVQFLKTL